MQVSDQTSANMESESYQELSAASLRWQSTAIPIPAIAVAAYQIYVASMLSMKNSLEQFQRSDTGYTRRQELVHDIVMGLLGVAEW